MIFVIDNYDSFTYNLVQYIGLIKKDIKVSRNDKFTLKDISKLNPTHIVISPGPGRPEDAGLTIDVINTFGKVIPILGVCLGHQAITMAFGGKIINCNEIVHGKTSEIYHHGSLLFKNLSNPFLGTRYHSLIAESKSFPACLNITAELKDGVIMGLQHEKYPIHGVQFHPESIGTDNGPKIIQNFFEMTS